MYARTYLIIFSIQSNIYQKLSFLTFWQIVNWTSQESIFLGQRTTHRQIRKKKSVIHSLAEQCPKTAFRSSEINSS